MSLYMFSLWSPCDFVLIASSSTVLLIMQNVKTVSAEKARECHKFRNIKQKLHKTIAAIWYKKTCRETQYQQNSAGGRKQHKITR
jgi:hypothetical protein